MSRDIGKTASAFVGRSKARSIIMSVIVEGRTQADTARLQESQGDSPRHDTIREPRPSVAMTPEVAPDMGGVGTISWLPTSAQICCLRASGESTTNVPDQGECGARVPLNSTLRGTHGSSTSFSSRSPSAVNATS